MFMKREDFSSRHPDLVAAALDAARDLQPGLAVDSRNGMPLELAAARMERAAGLRLFPDRAQLAARVRQGEITDYDIAQAIVRTNAPGLSVADIRAALDQAPPPPKAMPTIVDLAAEATGIDWRDMIGDRISTWAAGHYSRHHALWAESCDAGAWASWRDWAKSDLTPEILGLSGFVDFVGRTDRDPRRALGEACRALGVDPQAAPSLFERLLCDMWGWAQPLRAQVGNDPDGRISADMMAELLAIRLVWEQALHERFGSRIRAEWDTALGLHRQKVVPNRDHLIDAVLQASVAAASARVLEGHLRVIAPAARARPAAQLVFTADPRCERIRRMLESVAPEIHTLGVGDRFGLPADCEIVLGGPNHAGPTALPPKLPVHRSGGAPSLSRTLGQVSEALLSGFALVQAGGLLRVGALVHRSLGEQFTVIRLGRTPRLSLSPDSVEAADIAERALRRIGMTQGFAPLVVFVARQSRTWKSTPANDDPSTRHARALAQLLNETPVRQALAARGIEIDPKCVFMAAAHDTISDCVNLFMSDPVGERYPQSVRQLRRHFEQAATRARAERALDLPGVRRPDDLIYSGGDWAETAMDGRKGSCQWYVIGPRRLTAGANLAGNAALHDYDADADPDGTVLADILATEVLGTALALRRGYMSSLAPDHFAADDAGDGTLRSVTPRVGARDTQRPSGRLVVRVAASPTRLDTALARVPKVALLQEAGWIDIAPLERDVAPGSSLQAAFG